MHLCSRNRGDFEDGRSGGDFEPGAGASLDQKRIESASLTLLLKMLSSW